MKELKYSKTFENEGSVSNVFISTGKQWESTENNIDSIVESGPEGRVFNRIIEMINNSKEMICLQSFLIQDTKIIDALLLAKKERDVKIYILDSAEARLENKIEEADDFIKNEYVKMLNTKFKYNFVHRQASNLHAKFILIDPRSKNSKGVLFTGNFNEKPFFENPELAVFLSISQIKELFQVFVYHFWNYTTHEQIAGNEFESVKKIGDFKGPVLKEVLVVSPDRELSNLKQVLIDSIKKAKKEIIISTFGLDLKNDVVKEMLEKLKSGISLTIFCRPRTKAILNNIEILEKNGAKVFCHQLIHAKCLIVDEVDAYIFSANYEKSSFEFGLETGVVLNQKQTKLLLSIIDFWKASFPYKYVSNIRVVDLKNASRFNNSGRLESVNVKELEIEPSNKNIKKVKDLVDFFTVIKKPSGFDSKKIKLDKKAILNGLSGGFEIEKNVDKHSQMISYKSKKSKSQVKKAILIDSSGISQESILELVSNLKKNEFLELEIYAK